MKMCVRAHIFTCFGHFWFCETSVPWYLSSTSGVRVHDLSDSALVGGFKMNFNLGHNPPRQLQVVYTGKRCKRSCAKYTHIHTQARLHVSVDPCTHPEENTRDAKPFTSQRVCVCLCIDEHTRPHTHTHTQHGACLTTHMETHKYTCSCTHKTMTDWNHTII